MHENDVLNCFFIFPQLEDGVVENGTPEQKGTFKYIKLVSKYIY